MPWIKRNLLFVVGLAVAVALLGFGVFYLLGAQSEASSIEAELNAKGQEFDTLVDQRPAPTEENIKAAKEEQARAEKFRDTLRPQFVPLPLPETMDDAAFKGLLENTLDRLVKSAERAGARLPKVGEAKYAFTFDEQRRQLQMSQTSLNPLTTQLLDIADISQILFEAKIHSLEALRRTPVSTNDITPPTNYLAKKPLTNGVTGAVSYPYEVVFQCFSSELGGVLAGFVNAQQAYVIKTINVERGSTEVEAPASMGAFPAAGGMSPALAARYGMSPGLGARYGLTPPAPQPGAAKPGEAPLDDKPLRITLGLQVVKLAAPAPAATTPAKNKTR